MSDIINVWLDDEYGLQDSTLPHPGTVVDIGANIGLFSLWAWHRFPKARIHAFEPNSRVLTSLRGNLEPTGASIHQVGVSGRAGRAAMSDLSDSRLASTRTDPDGEVRLIPFSEVIGLVGGTVDLLKLDCEGAEWEIFEDRDAFKHVASIRMEYHLVGGRSLDDFKDVTKRLGFRLDRLSPNDGFGIAWLSRA